jgi:hypothetical protein
MSTKSNISTVTVALLVFFSSQAIGEPPIPQVEVTNFPNVQNVRITGEPVAVIMDSSSDPISVTTDPASLQFEATDFDIRHTDSERFKAMEVPSGAVMTDWIVEYTGLSGGTCIVTMATDVIIFDQNPPGSRGVFELHLNTGIPGPLIIQTRLASSEDDDSCQGRMFWTGFAQ